MADAYPPVIVAELIRMRHHGEGIAATTGHIGAGLAVIGAVDVFRTYHAGIVRHVKTVVGHEQIVVICFRIVDDLWSLCTLPTAVVVACIDALHHLVEFRQRCIERRHLL